MASHSATAPVGLVSGSSRAHKPGFFVRFFSAIGGFFSSLAEAQATAKHYEYLSGLSDAQLAVHGLKREDISRAVFEKSYHRGY
jgi:hypothetical protein